MTHHALRSRFFMAVVLAGAGTLAQAQPAEAASQPEPMLRGADVTESALVDALAIEAPEPPADAKTRGFRPAVRPPSNKPAAPGKASLLITFPTDSAELTAESKAALDTVAKALQSDKLAGFGFRVEGHADPRGQADRNMKLSQLRAQAVVDYLVTVRGVLPERLAPQGKGSTEPVDAARPEAPENRRVTIVTNR
ncbi:MULTISPECIES: OmpA family protein [Aquincola]|uniref:OmpA family protein n=1 Tax=Aquincola TaxID=391952 RepID=UPI001E2F51AF|nr:MULTISPECIES: OmpA family protein [Aquincola]MCR5865503.1 OmpA family protein [Aquincola sp. J276]